MSISELLVLLVSRVGLIVAAAFLLLGVRPVKRLGSRRSLSATLFFIGFFGFIGILGTYGGGKVDGSVANFRATAVVTAGLFGGPVVGLGAGLVAGLHRVLIDIGGFSAIPCGLATVMEGLAAGLIARRFGSRALDWKPAVSIAVFGEAVHMGLVLALSRPYADAVALVRVIAVPMIVSNAVGAGLFVQIIRTVRSKREQETSTQAEAILDIANQTVSHLRSGLTRQTAKKTARILYRHLPVAAVAITGTDTVLAHVGAGDDHHTGGEPIRTKFTYEVMEKGHPLIRKSASRIGCPHPGCPFVSAIVVPLKKGETVIGTLKFYGTKSQPLTPIDIHMAKGLGGLFSTQLELEDLRVQKEMLTRAELSRLQAQINPHFLFNGLNTIASFCRTDPTRARELIQNLAFYMRRNLEGGGKPIALSRELEQVRAYLAIAMARFGDRIRVENAISEDCLDWPIPPLVVQPLVENAILHGIAPLEDGGCITLSAKRVRKNLEISVEDDGVGMDPEKARALLAHPEAESRIGLANCHHRLVHQFGPESGLLIDTAVNRGFRIRFRIPASSALSMAETKPLSMPTHRPETDGMSRQHSATSDPKPLEG